MLNELVEIIEYIKVRYRFLVDIHGFQQPIERQGNNVFWVDYIAEEIAVEVEIDWMEREVFLLIVNLYEGRLPEGYYVTQGERSRVHLINVIITHDWTAEHTVIDGILAKARLPYSKKDTMYLKNSISEYQRLLVSCIIRILSEGKSLFKVDV